jgi:uncharacterized OsmC-like protein
MKLNNVDVDKLKETAAALEAEPAKAKKVIKIEGEWNLGEGPQFSATVGFEGGTIKFEADQPTFLGGGGTGPGPMLYCLYGSASCYAATYATLAATEGVVLKSLKITAESFIDFSRAMGLSDNPIAEKIKFILTVESDAPEEKLKELEDLAAKRCPAVYCLTNPIPLETELKIG